METIRDRLFDEGLRHDHQVIEDFVLENCTIEGSAGFRPDWSNPEPSRRPTIRNVTLRNTNAYSVSLEGAILEDVVVDATKAGKAPIFLRGNAYRHVSLKGRIGPIEIRGRMFSPFLDLSEKKQEQIKAVWDEANSVYYQTVDWALDISQASYGSLSICGVPAKLIRRDPGNTAVVSRERAIARPVGEIPLNTGLFHVVIQELIFEGYDDVVLIACPRSKDFRDNLEDLQILRDLGVAE